MNKESFEPTSLPTWASRAIRFLCDERFHEEITGDLDEMYHDIKQLHGDKIAQRRLFGTLFSYIRLYFFKNRTLHLSPLISISMWMFQLKLFVRMLRRNPIFSSINVVGLMVGFAICLLIYKYIEDERSVDAFHSQGTNIYRITTENKSPESSWETSAQSSRWIAPTLDAKYPEVSSTVRMFNRWHPKFHHNQKFYEHKLYFTESSLFSLFDFKLIKGNPLNCLDEPYAAVLTQKMADTYFPNEDPTGKTIFMGDSMLFIVTGIMENVPSNSHLQFDMLLSYSTFDQLMPPKTSDWFNYWVHTYFLISPEQDISQFSQRIENMVRVHYGKELEGFHFDVRLGVERFSDIYLHSKAHDQAGLVGNIRHISILALIALFMLILASINFINLTTARSLDRAKEIGIKKVIGSARNTLIIQFLWESIMMSLIALCLGVMLAVGILPLFNEIAGKEFRWTDMLTPILLAETLGIAILLGLISGIYPAWVLSGFRPSQVLKGKFNVSTKGLTTRRCLIVFQFTISLVLMIATWIAYKQLTYMQAKDLGFKKEQVLIVDVSSAAGEKLIAQYPYIKAGLLTNPHIEFVSASSRIPGAGRGGGIMFPEGMPEKQGKDLSYFSVDTDFLAVMGIETTLGRNFNPNIEDDEKKGILVNEALLQELGWTISDEVLGKKINAGWDGRELSIIGVYQNYHHLSPRDHIIPTLMIVQPSWYHYISIRYKAEELEDVLAHLALQWNEWLPAYPLTYFFLDEFYHRQYRADQRLMKLATIFSVIAIFIGGIGLFGLTMFMVQQRRKEIGIRKVLGASVYHLLILLSKEQFYLILIAVVIGSPLAFYLMTRWLEDYAFRIDMSLDVFLLSAIVLVLFSTLVLLSLTVKAALHHPIESLRSE